MKVCRHNLLSFFFDKDLVLDVINDDILNFCIYTANTTELGQLLVVIFSTGFKISFLFKKFFAGC